MGVKVTHNLQEKQQKNFLPFFINSAAKFFSSMFLSWPFYSYNMVKALGKFCEKKIFPTLCPGCSTFVDPLGLCPSCWYQLSWIHGQKKQHQCLLCSHPLFRHESWESFSLLRHELCEKFYNQGERNDNLPLKNHGDLKVSLRDVSLSLRLKDFLCFSCNNETPYFHHHKSLWVYGPLSKQIIFNLKHGGQKNLGPFLARLLTPLALDYPVDYIIPMPLHKKRLLRRGFNQMSVVGKYLSLYTGIPLLEGALKRQYNTPSQGGLSPSERFHNVLHAFVSKDFTEENHLKPQCHVLLLDDVFTTGASLNACSRVLLDHGVEKVFCLTLGKVL